MNEVTIFPLRPGPQIGGLRITWREKGLSLKDAHFDETITIRSGPAVHEHVCSEHTQVVGVVYNTAPRRYNAVWHITNKLRL